MFLKQPLQMVVFLLTQHNVIDHTIKLGLVLIMFLINFSDEITAALREPPRVVNIEVGSIVTSR
jgi:hypothetical protein